MLKLIYGTYRWKKKKGRLVRPFSICRVTLASSRSLPPAGCSSEKRLFLSDGFSITWITWAQVEIDNKSRIRHLAKS